MALLGLENSIGVVPHLPGLRLLNAAASSPEPGKWCAGHTAAWIPLLPTVDTTKTAKLCQLLTFGKRLSPEGIAGAKASKCARLRSAKLMPRGVSKVKNPENSGFCDKYLLTERGRSRPEGAGFPS